MTRILCLKDYFCEVHKLIGNGVRGHCTSITVSDVQAGEMGLTFTLECETSVMAANCHL